MNGRTAQEFFHGNAVGNNKEINQDAIITVTLGIIELIDTLHDLRLWHDDFNAEQVVIEESTLTPKLVGFKELGWWGSIGQYGWCWTKPCFGARYSTIKQLQNSGGVKILPSSILNCSWTDREYVDLTEFKQCLEAKQRSIRAQQNCLLTYLFLGAENGIDM